MKKRKSFKNDLVSRFDEVIMGEESEVEEEVEKAPAEPLKTLKENKPSTQSWMRTTYVLEPQLVEKIRALAYWKRVKVKDIVTKAFEDYLETVDEDLIQKSVEEYRRHGGQKDLDL